MNKQELINQVSSKVDMPKSQILNITDNIIGSIEKALKKGDKVQLVGFGSWQKKKRKARKGRNPQTGSTINIPAKNVVVFRAGQYLDDLVN